MPATSPDQPPPPPRADRLATEVLHAGGKTLFLDLKSNHRGRHFRVTEDTTGKRSAIVIPLESAGDFCTALRRLIELDPTL